MLYINAPRKEKIMRILGIDPGYAIVGWGVIDYENSRFRVVDYGSVQTKAGTDTVERLEKVYQGINTIIERTGVKIDITDDGAVSICGTDQKGMDEAKRMIEIITTEFEAGQIFTGRVVSIKEFGAFLEFAPGKEGMVHISKISKQRINRVEDVLTLGDKVKVICLGKDKMGRISFSMKDVPEEA